MISSKKLLTTNSTNDTKAAKAKMLAVEKSVSDIENHDKDMSDTPGTMFRNGVKSNHLPPSLGLVRLG